MNFAFGEEEGAARDLAREILEKELDAERLGKAESDPDHFDRALWGELAQAQLLGTALPESAGGSDYGYLSLCLVLQEVGRAVAPIPAHPTLTSALAIAEFGSDAQKKDLLPGVVQGDVVLAAALVEPGAEDPTRPGATAREARGAFPLTGLKACVPAARLAERVLVPARRGDGGVGLFLLDPRGKGVTLEPQLTTTGAQQFRLGLDGARAEPLGDPARGVETVEWLMQRSTAAVCAMQLGVSEKALEITAGYARERRQFDRPIGSFQAVHQRMGDAFIHLEAMRLTTWQAAWRLSRGESATDEVAVAKYWAAEGGQFIGYAAQHLHGGIGVDVDYPIARYYLWAKQLELSLGSATRQLAQIGARMAEQP